MIMNDTPKKIITGILSLFLLFSSLSIPNNYARAQVSVPVGDIVNLASHTTSAVQNTWISLKEGALDQIVFQIGQQFLRMMIQDVSKWAAGGFQGSPGFVGNPSGFFRGVADEIGGAFIEEVAPFLCEPFSLNIQMALDFEINANVNIQERVGCTITDVVGNLEGFMSGNFIQGGGWDNWFSISQNEQNNPVGAYLTARGAMAERIGDEEEMNVMELSWGSGFFSQVNEETGEIITPGTTINNQLNQALGSPMRQLELADEFNELIGAVMVGLVSRISGQSGTNLGSGRENPDGLRGEMGRTESTIDDADYWKGDDPDEFHQIQCDEEGLTEEECEARKIDYKSQQEDIRSDVEGEVNGSQTSDEDRPRISTINELEGTNEDNAPVVCYHMDSRRTTELVIVGENFDSDNTEVGFMGRRKSVDTTSGGTRISTTFWFNFINSDYIISGHYQDISVITPHGVDSKTVRIGRWSGSECVR